MLPLNCGVSSTVDKVSASSTWRLTSAIGLTLPVLVAGCSTLEVEDIYVVRDSNSESVVYSGDGYIVDVHVIPDRRFTSMGLLGVPAIPIYANSKSAEGINLEVLMTLRTIHSFSFSSLPCLYTAGAQALCPTGAVVEAKAMFADEGETPYKGAPRSEHIAQFYDANVRPLPMKLPRAPSEARITSDEIYRRYDYHQVPPWTLLEARVTYRYTCVSACPTEFAIDMKGFAAVDDVLRTNGTYTFHKERRREYNATREVQ